MRSRFTYRSQSRTQPAGRLRHQPDPGRHPRRTARDAGATSPRPDPRFGNIFVSQSIGYQNYHGLVTVLNKRFSHGVSFQASYHWSKVKGAGFANDFTGFGIFTSPSDPQNIESDHGTGDFDMPHRFVLTGVIEPRFSGLDRPGWRAGERMATGAANHRDQELSLHRGHRSRQQWRYGLQRSADRDRVQLVPRPRVLRDRCAAGAKISLAPSGQVLELIVEGFNLANRLTPQGATAVNRTWGTGTTPNATFGQIINSQAARQFQIAFRLTSESAVSVGAVD